MNSFSLACKREKVKQNSETLRLFHPSFFLFRSSPVRASLRCSRHSLVPRKILHFAFPFFPFEQHSVERSLSGCCSCLFSFRSAFLGCPFMCRWYSSIFFFILFSLFVIFMSESSIRQEQGGETEDREEEKEKGDQEGEMGQALTYIRRKDTQRISFVDLAEDIRASKSVDTSPPLDRVV